MRLSWVKRDLFIYHYTNKEELVINNIYLRFKAYLLKIFSNSKIYVYILCIRKYRSQSEKIDYYNPEQISSMILTKMKNIAEVYLKDVVSEAVITVPAYFNDSQRQATKDAGSIAGLKVLRIINEPTAAALAYGMNRMMRIGEQVAVIFDLGGGTFDVSIVAIEDGMFEVKATSGDTHLGGEDFDNILVEYCKKEYKKVFQSEMTDKRSLQRLKVACERAKKELSVKKSVEVNLCLLEGKDDLKVIITRKLFEELCNDLFNCCIDTVKECIFSVGGGFSKKNINQVILVGGSTRIPKIQQMLSAEFKGMVLDKAIHPDEAVACGAAVQAAIVSGCEDEVIQQMLLCDINPLSLGVSVNEGVMSTVVKRHSLIPTKKQKPYVTIDDNQESAKFLVYEGERPLVKDNNFLGEFTLSEIRKAPKGEVKFDVTFEIDSDGILHVSAIETGTTNENDITISNNSRLSPKKIQEMIQISEKYRLQDEAIRERIAVASRLEEFAYAVLKTLKGKKLSKKLHNISRECQKTIDWLYKKSVSFSIHQVSIISMFYPVLCCFPIV